ncbi:MAG TPA: hypothetical protein VGD56_04490 [Gemmatirosa sp.]
MQAHAPPPFVSVADGAVIRVHASSHADGQPLRATLVALGFHADPLAHEFVYDVHDESEEAHLLTALRDAGVHFVRDGEWSPAGVFARMRRRGIVVGPFRSIVWHGADRWEGREE